jgi:predicted nucleotide-binding protein
MLERSFTTSAEVDQYVGWGGFGSAGPSLADEYRYLLKRIHDRVQQLISLRDRLELFEEPEVASAEPPSRVDASGVREVFIVHGRDTEAEQTVARFLERVVPNHPVRILHEQADRGQTVIEKLERVAASVGFAVVLLIGDDVGGLARQAQNPRARQNVVLELGFFISKIGRSNVAVLYEKGVELPSDMAGVLYTELDDAGAWRLNLAQELRSAGIGVDADRLLG